MQARNFFLAQAPTYLSIYAVDDSSRDPLPSHLPALFFQMWTSERRILANVLFILLRCLVASFVYLSWFAKAAILWNMQRFFSLITILFSAISHPPKINNPTDYIALVFKMNSFTKLFTLLVALIAMNALPQAQAIKNCTALEAVEDCMRPRDTLNATGQFICRRRWQNGVGVKPRVKYQTLCIAKTWGKEGDQCGCCNGNCPSVCDTPCKNPVRDGDGPGVFVYDWYASPRDPLTDLRKCVTPGRSLQLQQQNGQRWNCEPFPGWNIPTRTGGLFP